MTHDPAASTLTAAGRDRGVRAALAARTVQELFGTRAFGLPGTWLGAVAFPHPGPRSLQWHYWWQAHLMDALVDAARREAASGADVEPTRRRAHRLLRAMALRSGGTVVLNDFYDDMAWLMLALGRLRDLDEAAGLRDRDVLRAGGLLLEQLRSAHTQDLGGGMFWNRDRSYKNTATTGPGALAAIRTGDVQGAAALLQWLRDRLWDAQAGVFHDGLKLLAAGSGTEHTELDATVYTYNSGPVLGAVLELARSLPSDQAAPWWEWAAQIVQGTDREFGREAPAAAVAPAAADAPAAPAAAPSAEARRVLRTHGDGDAGLFTGILARHLAQAALSPELDPTVRATAARLVRDTADALWEGRREFDPDLDVNDPRAEPDPARVRTIFSSDPLQSADRTQRVGAPVQLSGQVQAWTILEAAALLDRSA